MKKSKLLCLLLAVAVLLMLAGCASRAVLCDGCGQEIKVKESSNITDDWILYCKDCEQELFGEDCLVPKA